MSEETPAAAPVIDARDLVVRFRGRDGEATVLDGFSLAIQPHEIVGLVGESGSGKSTAALALLGLVRHPGRVTAGSVMFGGRDLLALSDDELRRIRGSEIGMITQKPRQSLNPMHTVGRQISRVYRAHVRAGRGEAARHTVDMLERVGINDAERRVHAFPHELSGGMAQRALIAMALSARPQLLIADEPTSGLDVTIQAQFLDRMWDTVKETGSAILLVTQDLGIIANYCDRVCVMEGGRIVEDRPVRDFFAAPEHPYSKRILTLQRRRPDEVDDAPPAVAEPLIEVERLVKRFPLRGSRKTLQAVSDVSFQVLPGRSLGLVGESGSGKTTVGRLLLRLVDATEGSVRFRGEEISTFGRDRFRPYRARLQVVFQDPFDSLDPRWTVARLLREPLDLHTAQTGEQKAARVAELLAIAGLDDAVRERRPAEISAGQQQRVCIARALATDPEFIVLDEPTSAIPPAARAETIGALRAIQERTQVSFLFISHDLTSVEMVCHDVAVMYLSEVVEIGARDDVFRRPQHPYTRALLASHLFPDPTDRRIDRPVRERLEGEIPSPIDLPSGCYLASRCPFAVDRCRTEPQTLRPLADGRQVRCWRVSEGDLRWDEASPQHLPNDA